MQLFNRDSRKTPAAQPFLAVSSHGRIVLKPLLAILGLVILVEFGPVSVSTVAWASSVLIQIFLGFCHLGIVVCQILGM
jgi:hypothetical protein